MVEELCVDEKWLGWEVATPRACAVARLVCQACLISTKPELFLIQNGYYIPGSFWYVRAKPLISLELVLLFDRAPTGYINSWS